MERLVIMTDSDEIGLNEVLNMLPESFARQFAPLQSVDDLSSDGASLRDRLEYFERQLLKREFNKAGGNVSRMAENLKTDRPNLHRKLKKHGIKL